VRISGAVPVDSGWGYVQKSATGGSVRLGDVPVIMAMAAQSNLSVSAGGDDNRAAAVM
jgi:hypothetical protein